MQGKSWFGVAMAAGFLAQAMAGLAAAAAPVSIQIDIPEQSLADSIQALARQTNTNILVDPGLVAGRKAPAISQQLSLVQALDRLLQGTGLISKFVDEKTIVVAAPPDASNNSERQQIEEILVTGTNIRGVPAVAAPVMVITREDLNKTGFATVQDVFRSLPQNLTEISADAATATGVSRIAGANTQGAVGISLRGLGPQSTLVLLNGKRRPANLTGQVVDISAIPLAVIERIEIVTGGNSAVYGSDAVAGVVNLITRHDFEGAQTQIQFGDSVHRGGEKLQASQIYGRDFGRGGFVAAYDFSGNHALDIWDTQVTLGPSQFGLQPVRGEWDVIPRSRRHSGFFSGHFDVTDRVELYGDALYTSIENEQDVSYEFPGLFAVPTFADTSGDQYSASGGVRFELGEARTWALDTSGLYGVVDNHETGSGSFNKRTQARLSAVSAIANGPLLKLGSMELKAALGVEMREESYRSVPVMPRSVADVTLHRDRNIDSAFAEVRIPFIENGARAGLRHLEASVAGRYDDYSDFGDTFNPQFGVLWKPTEGLGVRTAYAKAFRAPAINDLIFGNQIFLERVPDPAAPGGTSPALFWLGSNPDLQPEKASTWSFGFDLEPRSASWLSLSASYFRIEYENRIDEPVANHDEALMDAAIYSRLIERNPSAAQLAEVLASGQFSNQQGTPFDPATQQLLSVFPDLVLFDNRRNNVALDEVAGVDFRFNAQWQLRLGTLYCGLNGTYYLELDRRTTAASPAQDQLNRQGKPVDLRLRANTGWTRGPWSAFAYFNYVDDYKDTLASPAARIASWTTVDLSLRYDGSELADHGPLHGMSVTLSADNVLDADPPEFLSNFLGIGYDAANANPLGRVVSLRLVKSW